MRVAVIGNDPHYLVNLRGPLLRALAARGHEVHALAPGLHGAHLERVRELGAEGWPYSLERQGINPLVDVRTLLDLAAKIRRIQPHAVFAYTIKPLLYGTFAASLLHVPRRVSMVTGVGSAFTSTSNLRRRAIHVAARELYRMALVRQHVVFFQNPDDELLFRTLGLLRHDQDVRRVNGSGIDLQRFAASDLPAGTPTFTLVARLHHEKGVREFVEAARRVRRADPDTRFLLVGPFEQHPDAIRADEVERWVREGTLEYRGFLADVQPTLRETTVYVLPSYREGTPRSVLEAMALGRPVITTDAPGCRETVTDGVNGFRVPVRDVDALVSAMHRLVRDRQLAERMGRASRQIAESKYDVHVVNDQIVRALEGDEGSA